MVGEFISKSSKQSIKSTYFASSAQDEMVRENNEADIIQRLAENLVNYDYQSEDKDKLRMALFHGFLQFALDMRKELYQTA